MDNIVSFFTNLLLKLPVYLYNTFILNFSDLLQGVAVSCSILIFVLTIEVFAVGWKNSGFRRIIFSPSPSTINDLIFFFIHVSGIILILSWLFSLGLPVLTQNFVREFIDFNLGNYFSPIAHLCLFLFVVDFFNYWHHRFAHRFPLLWHIHAFHHSATEFNTMTVFREHPLDKALNSLIMIIPAVIIGVPVAEYPIFITIYGIIGYFKHSQLPWRMGWFGKYVIQSPVDHWIHHSTQSEHYDRNFANVFSFWDHVFGTYYDGNNINKEIGLPNEPYNKGNYVADFFRPQVRFLKTIFKKLTNN